MANDSYCDPATSRESPLACNLGAFTAAEKPRYGELRKSIASAVIGQRDLADGIALQIASDRIALADIAEWISMERRCCPFFDFRIDVARESGAVWLSLSGRAGVKEFITQAFSS